MASNATSAHAPSYYAATANWTTDYPQLVGQHKADVAIVGGGFSGISTALHLAERGYRVALVEARRIAWGASGRNGGQLLGGFSGQEEILKILGPEFSAAILKMGFESVQIVRDRIKQHAIDCDLKWGYFDAASKPRHMTALRSYYEQMQALGYDQGLRLIEQADLTSVIDSKAYIGGLVNSEYGHLHPLNLCIGEARAATALGVQIFEHSPVLSYHSTAKPTLHCAQGSLQCEYLVFAGNAYLADLVPPLRGMVIPAGSYIIATEALDEDIAQQILPQDMAVCDQNVVLDYFRLSADKRLLFGGRCNYSGRDPRDIAAVLAPRMRKVFPQLSGKRIDYQWGGYIGITLNRIPQLGRIKSNSNLLYAQGYSGHGVAASHLAGRLLAEAIAGDAERLDVFERIQHIRIPAARYLANPLLALGMLYYRLRDTLA